MYGRFHGFAFGIQDAHLRAHFGRVELLACKHCTEFRTAISDVKRPRFHCHRTGLVQPHVAVDAGPFVVPAFFLGSVAAHGHNVVFSVFEIGAKVVNIRHIAAVAAAQPVAVAVDFAVAVDALEFYPYLGAIVFCRNIKMLTVPAHGIGRILPSDTFVAVGMAGLGAERQVYHPVVGQVDNLPCAVVEGRIHRRNALVHQSRFGYGSEVFGKMVIIQLRRCGVSRRKRPSVVQQYG